MVPHFLVISLSFERTHSVSKHFIGLCLSTTSRSYKHQTMTDLNSVEQLNDFVEERLSWLELVFSTRLFDLDHEVSVINVRLFNTWEQVLNDVFEKGKIVFQEFWHVDVSQGSEKKLVFVHVWCCHF